MATSGTLSHATQVPVVSVNLSMIRTSRIWNATGSAIACPCTRKRGRMTAPVSGPAALLLGRRLARRLLREVVVRDELRRREHEALRRHDQRGVGALRIVHLLEERVR